MRNRKAIELWAYVLAILALVVAVDGSTIKGWWLYDDPQIVLQAVRNTPLEILFNPLDWRTLSGSNFTPLVTVSFDADLLAFGFHPLGYHVHQLASFALAAVLLFVLVRRFTPSWIAGAATAMFVLSAPGIHAASLLMLRHYVEGLALSLLALIAWDLATTVDGTKRARWRLEMLTVAATIAWLAAVLCKEVYATLPILMIAISFARGESRKRTIARLAPCVLAGVVYVLWRLRMLGTLGGYGAPDARGYPGRLAMIEADTFGSRSIVIAIGLVAIGLLVLLALVERRWSTAAGIAAFATTAAIPLAGVVGPPQMRYAFVPAVLTFGGAAIAGSRIRRASIAAGLIAIAAVAAAAGGVTTRRDDASSVWTMREEGRYVWGRNANAPVLLAGSPEWYLEGLSDMRVLEGRGRGPRYVLSPTALTLGEVSPTRVVFADASARTVHGLGPVLVARFEADGERLDPAIPLAIEISRRGDDVRWKFGPACRCTWTYLSYPHYGPTRVPSSGWLRLPEPMGRGRFRVRRDDVDGRWTISPTLQFPTDGETVRWSGPVR